MSPSPIEETFPMRTFSTLLLTALLAAPAATAQTAATQSTETDWPIAFAEDPYAWFDPIIDIQRLIANRFVTQPDLRELQLGAIYGMLQALDDRYTVFIPEESLADFDKALRGEYVGIGASVNITDGWATIVSPLDDSPSLAAGVLPGDRILEVDGQTTMGEDLDDTIDRIIGERGSTVILTLERGGEPITIPIVREPIVTRSVAGFVRDGTNWDYMVDPDDGIGYIRLISFGSTAAEEFAEALVDLQNQGAQGLIVDLRENTGGLLRAAIQIADLFLDEGPIVTTRGRAHDDQTFFASPQTLAPDLPLLVMITRRSASASEVLSGALADQNRAVILGERSFGKGLVQDILELPSGAGQLKITEQRYYGPSDKLIQREDDSADWGVDPTPGFFVSMTNRETSHTLRIRAADSVIRPGSNTTPRPAPNQLAEDWVRERYADTQLASAIEAMRTRVTTGDWSPISDANDSTAPSRQELLYAVRARDYLLRELERANERIGALATVADENEADALSLLPDDANLDGGTVEVRDADGNLVGTLNIVGDNLERWFVDAPLEPAKATENQ